MLLDLGETGLTSVWECAGNTFPRAVGAGNTCRSFLLGVDCFCNQIADHSGFVFSFGKKLKQFRVLVFIDPQINANGVFCVPSLL